MEAASKNGRLKQAFTAFYLRFFRRRWHRRANQYLWEDALVHMDGLAGRRVLFIGCGTTSTAVADLASRGADVWCADISPDLLQQLMRYPFGELAGRVHAVTADAERMPFGEGVFDMVVGKAIVHHLNIPAFLAEVDRVTVPGATLVFSEPLGANPLINLFRWLTPALRDADEHPLRHRDIQMIRGRGASLEAEYHFLFSAASFPWYLVGLTKVGDVFFRAGCWLDRIVFRIFPPARWLAWAVTLVGRTKGETGKVAHG